MGGGLLLGWAVRTYLSDSSWVTPNPRILRIGSLNTWGTFSDWPSRLSALQKLNPAGSLDVLLAQEVCIGDEVNQLEELSQAFDLPYHAYHSDKETHGLHEGVAILCREPLTTVSRTNLGNGRVLIAADSFGRLTLACAHLSFEGRERSEQVKALLKRVSLSRVVLGGDFNGELSTFEEALDRYWADSTDDTPTWPVCGENTFRDAWEAFTGRPVNFSLEPRRVDYILTRGLKPVRSATVALEADGVFVSDHALVTSEVELL